MDAPVKRIPTGVADFDNIIRGGMPIGSVVLLLGDLGAGQQEYALTSAAKISLIKENPDSAEFFLGHSVKGQMMPESIHYITFSRSKEDILQELEMSFNEDFFESFERNVIFKDFSSKYFRQTLVPKSWSGDTSSALFSNNTDEEGVLEGLVNYLDQNAPRSMVIIDSLTDLVLNQKIDPKDLVAVLRGMQRVSKKWGGVVYLLLTKDIIEDRLQRMIMDSVDGALVFEWSRFVNSSKRQRYLYVEKFMSILPHLDRGRIARFATTVTAQSGLVVIDTERIG
jgi:KaiC/GvpD/RAD55 family RecA-like ATPase